MRMHGKAGCLATCRHSATLVSLESSGIFGRRCQVPGFPLSHIQCVIFFFFVVVVCKTLNNLSADSHEKATADDLPDGIYSTFSDWLTDMATANPRKTKIGEIRLF